MTNEEIRFQKKYLKEIKEAIDRGDKINTLLIRRVLKEFEKPEPQAPIKGLPEDLVTQESLISRMNLINEIYDKLDDLEISENKTKTALDLPIELSTDKAKNLLSLAISNGICDNNYKWLKSKALLAYFADRASEYLELGKGEYDGKRKISWKPFETLFGNKGLSGAKRDYQKTGTLPDGYKDVDKLFE